MKFIDSLSKKLKFPKDKIINTVDIHANTSAASIPLALCYAIDKKIVNNGDIIALNAIGADVGFVEIESDKGHDSFLFDVPDFLKALKNFLDQSYTE